MFQGLQKCLGLAGMPQADEFNRGQFRFLHHRQVFFAIGSERSERPERDGIEAHEVSAKGLAVASVGPYFLPSPGSLDGPPKRARQRRCQ